jgi:hypothetical protein
MKFPFPQFSFRQSSISLVSVTIKDKNMYVAARHAVPWAGGFETHPYESIFMENQHSATDRPQTADINH